MFKEVSSQVDFPTLEQEMLRFWEETRAFEQLVEKNRGNPPWSFIDGPITANNPMGVHHAWGRTYKDLWQRFKAMQGYDQRWQNGFDCQGLWVEVEVEKELGFQSKRDIEAFGMERFVRLCKERVLRYAAIQTEQSKRLGMWMKWDDPATLRWLADHLDVEKPVTVETPAGPVTDTVERLVGKLGHWPWNRSYFTFSDENNYSIWHFLKVCHQHGWLYKGTDVMPWCARCGTGLSQHEIVTEGYKELTHPGLTVRFPLEGRENEALLVWTTTPWTLTSNVAAAVGPELTYLKVRQEDWVYYVAKGAAGQALVGAYEVLEELPGTALVGLTYRGPFDELPAQQGVTHRVIAWDEVGEEEGTGIVHIAPGCGAEDFALSKKYDLPVIAPLDEFGVYIEGFDGTVDGVEIHLTGRPAMEVADDIIENLKAKGLFYHVAPYTHRYPVCWRCGTELVFRLVEEWFISMDELRHKMMDVTRQIRWIPGFGLERELDWLRNMHDWMISKKRYWGLALPIWVCEDCGHFDVIGSQEELAERAIAGWEKFEGHTPHRPYIDEVKIACAACGGTASRIPDVGNPWLDAGIVPFSTLHYRDDRAYWEKWFPADFITESFPGQFRNWFYSLLAMSTALENRPPFLTVLGYATLLAEDGREMHKSWGNAIEFNEAADSMGADVMRWMYASHKPEQNLLFGYGLANEVRRRFLLPLWNVYSFFVTYANLAEEWSPNSGSSQPTQDLDRWILARLQQMIEVVTDRLEDYDAYEATHAVEAFVEDLSNWYVRRSRRRFWEGEPAALSTLYQVLTTLAQVVAPVLPFTAEAMYQNLVRSVDENAPVSVHLTAWPTPDAALVDQQLLDGMRLVMRLAALGRAARGQAGFKLRQPLPKAYVALTDPAEREAVERLREHLLEELNVKALEFVTDESELVTYTLRPVFPLLGPKYGPLAPKIKAALQDVDARAVARELQAGKIVTLVVEGQTLELEPDEVEVLATAREGFAVAEEAGRVVAVDTELTPLLRQEGLARDVVRRIQMMRREAGFEVTDRIATTYQADGEVATAIEAFRDYIAQETLSVTLEAGPPASDAYVETVELDGQPVVLGVRRLVQEKVR